ncbi:hypothetical protein GZ77_08745 [Endozoicomonas montiporae]|uniref:PilX/PilW C-terminal domain-containing protein n=2 Tax=Endozoicomonas montiporae TaxID=1027273 RepID=A0A081N7M1_9GAMM|nr:pilus assembly protein [Endozoicomonas montiporae]AMO55714.1 type IV pilus assembly protein PilX [Endozoicomonas montiporae CL-33]KEQ14444.1 hypothetical protein GZ77_08745 [Endozoicomonas montiporae]
MHNKPSRQCGSALLYSITFVGLMAFAGLITIQSSSLLQKVSASYRNNQIAQVAAEAALLEAERCLVNQSACYDISQFDSSCSNGLCFNGTRANSIIGCRSGNTKVWQDSNLWKSATRTINASSTPSGTSSRYIIEFICYTPRILAGLEPDLTNPADWSKYYRITALSRVDNTSTHVMLQSTFKR